MDIFLSYLAIAYTFSPFYSNSIRNIYHALAAPGVAIAIILTFDDMLGAIVVVGVSVSCFMLYEIDAVYRRYQRHWLLLPAVALFVGGIACKYYSDKYSLHENLEKYVYYHSSWHILTALASTVLYCSIETDDKSKYLPLRSTTKAHKSNQVS
jgi:hypothetical protein